MENFKVSFVRDVERYGIKGQRYWFYHPFSFTARNGAEPRKDVDDILSSGPVEVFVPDGRNRAETPIIFRLQGICAPLDMNSELVQMVRHGFAFDLRYIHQGILVNKYGLTSDRIALFGVSMGAILSSSVFVDTGFGKKLLAVIGHPDVRTFAQDFSRATISLPVAGRTIPVPAVLLSPWIVAAVVASFTKSEEMGDGAAAFVELLKDLSRIPGGSALDIVSRAKNVSPPRSAYFLIGGEDKLAQRQHVHDAANRFRPGIAYVTEDPKMGHGGMEMWESVMVFLRTRLNDWGVWQD
ncbi:hypothetical protein DFJ74DRAFT_774417 [Hyaloraphidium curvatum]|nr:hypothetical protein DFJ74DRAFT_774417 [Hyaloraphidium curvatum]